MLPPLVCPHCHAFTQGRMTCPNPHCAKAVASGIDGSQPRRVLAEVGGPINGRPVVLYAPSDAARSPWIAVGYAGVEDRSGGVAVIDFLGGARHQRVDVHAGVTNLTALPGHRLAFGDAGGRFHVLDLVRGAVISSDTALEGSVVAAPVVLDDAAAILVSQQGEIAEVDLRSARIVRVTRVPPEQGGTVRIVAEPVVSRHHGILICTIERHRSSGRLLAFDRPHGHLETICRFDAGIYSTPVLVDDRTALLALAGQKGNPSGIAAVDLQRRLVAPDLYPTQAYIRATPSQVQGHLYFGDYSHRLHAIEVGTMRSVWKRPLQWRHSIVSSPLVLPDHNVALFSDTHGHVVAIDLRAAAASAEGDPADSLIWSIELPETSASGSPRPAISPGGFVRLEEQVCFGTMGGQLIALPFFHDRADWAAQDALRQRRPRRAAALAILARGTAALPQAVEILRTGGHDDLAGALLETMDDLTEAAAAYRKSGLWDKAARIYQDLGDLQDLQDCLRAQAEADGLPFLTLEVARLSPHPLKVDEAGKITLRLANLLPHRARRLALSFSGPFGAISSQSRSELVQGRPWELVLDVMPQTPGAVDLVVTVHVRDGQGRAVRPQELRQVLVVAGIGPTPIIHNVHVDTYIERVDRQSNINTGGDAREVSITEHHHHPAAPDRSAPEDPAAAVMPLPTRRKAAVKAGKSIGVVTVKGHDDTQLEAGEDIGMAEVD